MKKTFVTIAACGFLMSGALAQGAGNVTDPKNKGGNTVIKYTDLFPDEATETEIDSLRGRAAQGLKPADFNKIRGLLAQAVNNASNPATKAQIGKIRHMADTLGAKAASNVYQIVVDDIVAIDAVRLNAALRVQLQALKAKVVGGGKPTTDDINAIKAKAVKRQQRTASIDPVAAQRLQRVRNLLDFLAAKSATQVSPADVDEVEEAIAHQMAQMVFPTLRRWAKARVAQPADFNQMKALVMERAQLSSWYGGAQKDANLLAARFQLLSTSSNQGQFNGRDFLAVQYEHVNTEIRAIIAAVEAHAVTGRDTKPVWFDFTGMMGQRMDNGLFGVIASQVPEQGLSNRITLEAKKLQGIEDSGVKLTKARFARLRDMGNLMTPKATSQVK